jgi:MerR family copper efflux transcriptional regulator
MSDTSPTLRIGQLAEETGMSVEALRYYERIRLLPAALRTSGGMRLYDERAAERVRFIRQAQRNGLSLADIRALLALRDRGKCREVLKLLTERITNIDAQVAELTSFRRVLDGYAEQCRRAQRRAREPECPVVNELGKAKKKA